jgi:hypothetical protein
LLSFLIPQAATFQALSLYDSSGLKPIVIRWDLQFNYLPFLRVSYQQ